MGQVRHGCVATTHAVRPAIQRSQASLATLLYRIATERGWTLEVVHERGTSIVWDDPFASDLDADTAFRDTLAREGIQAFLDSD